jgi:hypothetical protein
MFSNKTRFPSGLIANNSPTCSTMGAIDRFAREK